MIFFPPFLSSTTFGPEKAWRLLLIQLPTFLPDGPGWLLAVQVPPWHTFNDVWEHHLGCYNSGNVRLENEWQRFQIYRRCLFSPSTSLQLSQPMHRTIILHELICHLQLALSIIIVNFFIIGIIFIITIIIISLHFIVSHHYQCHLSLSSPSLLLFCILSSQLSSWWSSSSLPLTQSLATYLINSYFKIIHSNYLYMLLMQCNSGKVSFTSFSILEWKLSQWSHYISYWYVYLNLFNSYQDNQCYCCCNRIWKIRIYAHFFNKGENLKRKRDMGGCSGKQIYTTFAQDKYCENVQGVFWRS